MTKLYMPPPRSALLPRPRLTRAVTRGLERPLLLISAPAGFGKTTLLGEWRLSAEGRDFPLAWVSLDSHDSDPAVFWPYVIAALRALPGLADRPDLGRITLELVQTGGRLSPAHFLAPLLNDLVGVESPFALVLDDYHAIDSPPVHEALTYLVDRLPPAARLVLLTRADPPWPLARMRANGRVAELRAVDLRFTTDEAACLLNQTLGLGLSPTDVALLEKRTEGWAAALHLAALSLEGQSDKAGFIRTLAGENRLIADYLAEEVVAKQPDAVQRFLVQTAVLDRFCTPLCDAVTDRADGPQVLEQIERANLFLVPLDAERRWFRYHHLFGDLLKSRLRHTCPDLEPELYRRAAVWLEANGHPMEAAGYALAAKDYEGAARILEANGQTWWNTVSTRYVRLLLSFPPAVVQRRPGFCLFLGWFHLVVGQIDQAAQLVAAARDTDAPDMLRFIALMEAYIAEQKGQPLDEPVDPDASRVIPEQNVAMRNSADVMLAHLLARQARLDEAALLLQAVADREMANDTTNGIPIAIGGLARIRLIQGRATEAERLLRQALEWVGARGDWRFFSHGSLQAMLSAVLVAQGRTAEALDSARLAVEQNELWGVPQGLVLAWVAVARACLTAGDLDGAGSALDQADALGRGRFLSPDLGPEMSALRVRLWLARGDVARAERWAAERGLTAAGPLVYRREVEHVALARILIARGARAEAAHLLDRLAAEAERGGRQGTLAEIRRLRGGEAPAGSRLAEPLSDRELEILRLVAAGRSNQEIADQLYLALGTVKTHVHNLCGKLGAQSRTEAVARGREFGLL